MSEHCICLGTMLRHIHTLVHGYYQRLQCANETVWPFEHYGRSVLVDLLVDWQSDSPAP